VNVEHSIRNRVFDGGGSETERGDRKENVKYSLIVAISYL